MKIRTIYLMVMVWSFFSLFGVAVAVAGDCAGSYKTISNYNKSRMGSPCKYLGLDSHRGTCQQGQAYETLCDDASGGRYKTCQGPRSCYATQQPQQPVTVAGDCAGSYKTIPNYNKSRMGSPCKYLGLDSHRGTCQQGQAYETLCDDASGGRYKTCQGPRSCYATQQPQQLAPPATNQLPCTAWDYNYNQPCPAGFYNRDCRGGCER